MTTIIRELKADNIEEFYRFHTEHFDRHEPALQTPGFDKVISISPGEKQFYLEIIRQGLSLVAVDPNNNNCIVGTAVAYEMDSKDFEKKCEKVNEKKPTNLLEHILYLIGDLERRAQVFDRYDVSKALYLGFLTVDSSRRRQGIGRRLVTALMDKGRSKGLPLLATCCTSNYSTRVMLSLGMDCVLSEAYTNYKDEDGNAILRPPQPHKAVNIMAMKL